MALSSFTPRQYQQQILDKTIGYRSSGSNVIIELDCGAGKRFLQTKLVDDLEGDKILLLLQASTSLHETFTYLSKHLPNELIGLLTSNIPTKFRRHIIEKSRIILSLPQTFYNTIKDHDSDFNKFDVIIINEVDQIVRRMSTQNYLKVPYNRLFNMLHHQVVIGMSGTLRDDHFVLDKFQLAQRKDLDSLLKLIPNTKFISMDSILDTDFFNHVTKTEISVVNVTDPSIISFSALLEEQILQVKAMIKTQMENSTNSNIAVHLDPRIDEDERNKLSKLYFVRKYLWAFPGDKVIYHLKASGIDLTGQWLNIFTGKFHATKFLIEEAHKSVILCSYISTCERLSQLIGNLGISNVVITGKVPQMKRNELLESFRKSESKMVAILSNVGERDLDIPEADQLIIFDLVRTTKTVYQKLKRTRGGKALILTYSDTKEVEKADSVLKSIMEHYPWSTEIFPSKEIIVQ